MLMQNKSQSHPTKVEKVLELQIKATFSFSLNLTDFIHRWSLLRIRNNKNSYQFRN